MKKSDCARWRLVEKTTRRYARVFGLRLKKVQFFRAGYYSGLCYYDGRIKIAIRDPKGKLRKSYEVFDTVAHELAHLAHFNHRTEWMLLFSRILTRMATDGVLDKFRRKW